MTNVILKVRGGGIFLRLETKSTPGGKMIDYVSMRMENVDNGIEATEQGIALLSKSAMVGMIARLLGETRPLYKKPDSKIVKIQTLKPAERTEIHTNQANDWENIVIESIPTKIAVEMVRNAQIRMVMEPFIDVFYERRDQGIFITSPSAKLTSSWSDMNVTIQLFEKILKTVTGFSSPVDINNALSADKKQQINIYKKEPLNNLDVIRLKLPSAPVGFPTTGTAAAMREMIETVNNSKYKVDNDKAVIKNESFTFPMMVRIFEETFKLAASDTAFNQALADGFFAGKKATKLSVLTDPDQTGQWMDAKSGVQGAPSLLARTDFDILLENVSEQALEMLDKGPQIAGWGEGGRVKWSEASNDLSGFSKKMKITLRRNDFYQAGFGSKPEIFGLKPIEKAPKQPKEKKTKTEETPKNKKLKNVK